MLRIGLYLGKREGGRGLNVIIGHLVHICVVGMYIFIFIPSLFSSTICAPEILFIGGA